MFYHRHIYEKLRPLHLMSYCGLGDLPCLAGPPWLSMSNAKSVSERFWYTSQTMKSNTLAIACGLSHYPSVSVCGQLSVLRVGAGTSGSNVCLRVSSAAVGNRDRTQPTRGSNERQHFFHAARMRGPRCNTLRVSLGRHGQNDYLERRKAQKRSLLARP